MAWQHYVIATVIAAVVAVLVLRPWDRRLDIDEAWPLALIENRRRDLMAQIERTHERCRRTREEIHKMLEELR